MEFCIANYFYRRLASLLEHCDGLQARLIQVRVVRGNFVRLADCGTFL